ncbi:valine--tRNA ligase [Desulfurivibrio alkaliphilus]|uniref:Valine--tRNA ligase n=1 Tax=Desulfurivibrio alkaliphilus (strain DSM 19089 / UNIQEM U267 / AHT2) TaxID=589865 RepID=D6Z2H4_DESAT|nr:valine--tRNA ligase [Desulfurivibrio alkaliphilus]ADH85749.1 valyl-tRNA synthetase [Desulfurivibrio alkaliphilus AHT 2]
MNQPTANPENKQPAPTSRQLPKAYEFREVEDRWYQNWLEHKNFRATMDESRPSFSIVIPPPNVTGVLHVGHALNNTLQDILVRYRRMQGYNVLWLPGTDHAGIATQNVVERQLAAKGVSRQELGRDKFIERVWQWKEESGGQIINQLKRLGCSCDWERERFTMDEGLSQAVRTVFVRLYKEGLIYRGNYIINWCPRCHTALADVEVEHEETAGALYHIRYPLADGSGHVVVATTRPETMLGDTAVAVHPADERYRELKEAAVILPLVNRKIPIVYDTHVEKDFGSGALKVTPAHDLNDFEIGRRHQLPVLKVMDDHGMMNEEAGAYAGLDRFACREKIVADLKAAGLLEKIEDYQHGVGHCYRCQTVVETALSRQWFVAVKPLAQRAADTVRQGEINLLPKMWHNTFYEWMDNIRDWCISRQIWWGHRIPAWTCEACGELIVEEHDPDLCPKCGSSSLHREEDVLDTWFSSALWPFSTLGWPEKTKELQMFYPTSVLITSFDILFFWVARMMMMGLHFMDQVPFRDVYLHALVRDKHGKKMSKSKGNVLDPLELMDQYGTDALRFTMAAFAAQGRDIKLAEERIEGYRHFINKLWNAARFTLMQISDHQAPHLAAPGDRLSREQSLAQGGKADGTTDELSLPHRWILSRAGKVAGEVGRALDDYRFNDAANAAYQFVWKEFCDWYLEWIKPELYGDDPALKARSRAVLLRVLEDILKILHPMIPFVTEEIWHALPGARSSIMVEPFPVADPARQDEAAEAQAELLMEVVGGIRNIRSTYLLHPSATIKVGIICSDPAKLATLQELGEAVKGLTRSDQLEISSEGRIPAGNATHILPELEIFVPLAGLVDVAAECAKLDKEEKKLNQELQRIQGKLGNEKFLAKAPPEVVAKEQAKKDELMATLGTIEENRRRLQAIG